METRPCRTLRTRTWRFLIAVSLGLGLAGAVWQVRSQGIVSWRAPIKPAPPRL